MQIRIYHNPACSTSRATLALLREAGVEPEIVEYLDTPPDAGMLALLLSQLGLRPRALIRSKQPEYAALGLDDASLSDTALIAAMVAHPILIERPIVATPTAARLGRPPEQVLALLPPVQGAGVATAG